MCSGQSDRCYMTATHTTQLTDYTSVRCLLFCPEQRAVTEVFLYPALGLQVSSRGPVCF